MYIHTYMYVLLFCVMDTFSLDITVYKVSPCKPDAFPSRPQNKCQSNVRQ